MIPVLSETGEQLTQLQDGEPFNILEQGERWLVECPWQPQWSDGWRPYRGWIEPTEATPLPYPQKAGGRDEILAKAKESLGEPYEWGGLDCSGLVHLAYRSIGVMVPRDSKDQYRAATPVDELQRGDLLFFSKSEDPEEIHHVMLYVEKDLLLEAARPPGHVLESPLSERIKGKYVFAASLLTQPPSVRYDFAQCF
jgi:gamma-D-glutamyl-L-lysine dipeptidyl-peptidase